MNCRKCGAKHITRRAAGLFSCRHCGIQPGPVGFDRAGLEPRKDQIEQTETEGTAP